MTFRKIFGNFREMLENLCKLLKVIKNYYGKLSKICEHFREIFRNFLKICRDVFGKLLTYSKILIGLIDME